ncbi:MULTISPECIES: IS21 family transposase [Sandaracinus]|uniref:IS21 family transposase n=1 Tax=Sandaracinus TaxID=1055688 RepID=UPI0019D45F82|nr:MULTISPECIES: IS21 family transposase [Sandaracinus]QRN75805.1 Integrase [Sandaracinus sp.]UJR87330.1 Integrase catalytic subunit [Sandaracinus amylolyticus]
MLFGTVAVSGADGRGAGDMLPLLKRHEIQVLLSVGIPLEVIEERTGASIATIKRIRDEAPVEHVDDRAEHRKRGIGRPSKTAPFADDVRAWLEEEPELPTQELLRRALDKGYDGGKSAFYALVAASRPARTAPVVRFEGLPGELSQHDFGHVDVRFVDGTKKRVHFFASRLKYSRFVAVTLVPNERVETLVRTLVRHFNEFGRVPLLAVFDRPRTIVSKSGPGREVEQFNTTFAEVMLELGVGAEMCAPRSGNQKGSVEQLVKWVKSSFFKWRKFADERDLEAQLAAWVRQVNFETPSRATSEIPEARRQKELPRLRPVRLTPETLALRVPVFVGPTAEVMFEGRAYSMPPQAANVPGTAFVYEDRLRIVAGRYEAEHVRGKPGDPPASLPQHRADKLAAVHGARARLYEMREQLLRLGPDALALLTALTHRAPTRSAEHVERLYALYEEHDDDAMRAAISRAVVRGTLTVSAVREALSSSDPSEGRARARPHARGATARTTVTAHAGCGTIAHAG